MLTTFLLISGSIIIFLIIMIVVTLHTEGAAHEWFSDHENINRFRKHFAREGITVFVSTPRRTVEFLWSENGGCHSKEVTLGVAVKMMQATKDGGRRAYMRKYFKNSVDTRF
ncbi:hypothetical protein [Klebsiella phage DP]|nr:hypothetical protein [Klebsiella phage DP]